MTRSLPEPALAKILLHNRGGDTEFVWCTVVDAGKGLYRVANIPVLRVRPTYGDVIVATPNREGVLAHRRTQEVGGFRVQVLEYKHKATVRRLVAWLEEAHGIISEGLFEPEGGSPGIVAVAIPAGVSDDAVGEGIRARFRNVRFLPSSSATSDTKSPSRARAASAELHEAAEEGDIKKLKAILARGVNVNTTLGVGQTAAQLAALRGDARVLAVLRDAGANLMTRNSLGQTPVLFAAGDGDVEVLKVLLKGGVDPNEQRNRYRQAPLHHAAMFDRAEAVKLLLRAGASVEVRDCEDFTPLMYAAERSSLDTARVLLARCAASDVSEALIPAARRGHLEMVKLLLAAGADPSFRRRGKTALMSARRNKKASVVKFLENLPTSTAATAARG